MEVGREDSEGAEESRSRLKLRSWSPFSRMFVGRGLSEDSRTLVAQLCIK